VFERFTDASRSVVVVAQEEARRLRHATIGTEHLLLGVLAQPDSIGGQVLAGAGLDLAGVRRLVAERVPAGATVPERIPFTPRSK
jgi:ATP-dependent Clp protease ATP-binding subunit ClpC